ncbi:MAG: hypothetical protein IPO87_04470 [Flavobacteriales bacterium]|nr:hypothetical protein [Flavobacteriales bacterium]
MKKRDIRRFAEERFLLGYSRQQVQNELVLLHPEVAPKRIAGVIRYLAPEATRSHFRAYQQGLLAVMVLAVVLELVQTFNAGWIDRSQPWGWLSAVPFATLFLGYSIYRWRGNGLSLLVVLSGMGAFGMMEPLRDMFNGHADQWELGSGSLSLLISILAGYLLSRAFPKFKVEEDPSGVGPPRIIFPSETGMAMM